MIHFELAKALSGIDEFGLIRETLATASAVAELSLGVHESDNIGFSSPHWVLPSSWTLQDLDAEKLHVRIELRKK